MSCKILNNIVLIGIILTFIIDYFNTISTDGVF